MRFPRAWKEPPKAGCCASLQPGAWVGAGDCPTPSRDRSSGNKRVRLLQSEGLPQPRGAPPRTGRSRCVRCRHDLGERHVVYRQMTRCRAAASSCRFGFLISALEPPRAKPLWAPAGARCRLLNITGPGSPRREEPSRTRLGKDWASCPRCAATAAALARLLLGQTLQRSLGLSEPDARRTGGNCGLSWLLIRCPRFPTGASEGRVSAHRQSGSCVARTTAPGECCRSYRCFFSRNSSTEHRHREPRRKTSGKTKQIEATGPGERGSLRDSV